MLMLLSALPAAAQFYTDGEDPAAVRWWSRETQNYRLIYPEGLDSLASVYGRLEFVRPIIGLSLGMTPGEAYKAKTDVVLHPFNASANGSVTWTPKRMDFFTVQEPYGQEPIPWVKSLSIHESRHLAQMQFGYKRVFKPFGWLLGEMFPGAMAGIYPGPALLEGDAVVAETALSRYGRGRNADFLSYYHIAFDQGDMRDWHQWRWGSYRRYAPDHYALGYMTVAGVRYLYDDPLFMARYFDGVARRPWRIGNLQREVKAVSGKRFRDSFADIQADFLKTWKEEEVAREPFTPYVMEKPAPSWYTEYGDLDFGRGGILAIRSGLLDAGSLVVINPDGSERFIRPLATNTGGFNQMGDRLYWSESVPDIRWGKKSSSRIRYMDSDGKIHNLTRKGHLYNPVPLPDGTVAAVDYPLAGGSAIVHIDDDGKEIRRFKAPDDIQFVELELAFDGVVVTGISENGYGLYLLKDNCLQTLLEPQPVSLHDLSSEDEGLLFVSDRSGISEAYLLRDDLTLLQMTSTRYGVGGAIFSGDTLIFSVFTAEGQLVAESDELLRKPVRWGDNHAYKVADRLSVQEAALQKAAGVGKGIARVEAPKRYRKVPHIPHFHSWAPLYVNYNSLSSFNFENVTNVASVGATGFFQNVLGTASGSIAYAWKPDALGRGPWRHSAHLDFTYSGLYPVFDLSFDFNDRAALQYSRRSYISDGLRIEQVGYQPINKPLVSLNLSVYVPMNFSSGGWRRGLTPQLRLSISNDRYDKSATELGYADALEGNSFTVFSGYKQGDNLPMNRLEATLSGYIMRSKGPSETYPQWGIGAQAGYRGRMGLTDLYAAATFGYLYGYVPGILRNHGLRLSALWQHNLGVGIVGGDNVVDPVPRGLSDSMMMQYFAFSSRDQLKLTADYAFPFWVGDISWFSPVAYITHFVLTPHIDYTMFSKSGTLDCGLGSAGFDFVAKMPHFLWLPYESELGFTFDWNFGPSAASLRSGGMIPEKQWYIGLIFNVSL